jgi:PiT family inorganic phosphate transporter
MNIRAVLGCWLFLFQALDPCWNQPIRASNLGIPVSTTHTITGAIVGVGAVRNKRAVRWTVAGRIVWAWLLTIPAAGLIAAAIYALIALGQRIF